MSYSTGSHTVVYHRYHIVWITKYRYKVPQGKLRERVRDIIRQVCREMGVQIIEGVLSSDHIHMFVSVPPPSNPMSCQPWSAPPKADHP
jgi:putative transposase